LSLHEPTFAFGQFPDSSQLFCLIMNEVDIL
jgi:hypothetical protein